MVLGALALTMGVVVVTYVRRNTTRPPLIPVPALPKGVQRQLSGFTFTRSNGDRRVFTIRADRTLAFKADGATVLSNVEVEFFGRDGRRRDILRTREGTYLRSSGDFAATADVRIELNAPVGEPEKGGRSGSNSASKHSSSQAASQPFIIDTSGVAYHFKSSTAETAAPVEFRAGPLAGSAVGMNYAVRDGWLELDKNVTAVLNPQKGSKDRLPLHLSASKARFDKNTHEAEFWGPVEIRQGDRTATAQHLQAAFDDNHRVTQVTLEGRATFNQTSPKGRMNLSADRAQGELDPGTERLETLAAEGNVRGESVQGGRTSSFEANRLVLEFGGGRLLSGRGSGNVQLRASSPAHQSPSKQQPAPAKIVSASRQELTTGELDFKMRPGTAALESAATAGEARLILFPQGPREGRRTVTAGRFLFGFDAQGRLATLQGRDGTRIDFMPSADSRPGTAPAVTTAKDLLAKFNPAKEALQSVVQTGDFKFKQSDDQARAEKADYSAASGSISLTGNPEAWNPATRMSADNVKIRIESGSTEAEGAVRVTHTGSDSASGLPSNILADRATADRPRQIAHYSGNVRAWHGTDVIETPALEIDRAAKRIQAGPPVTSSYMVTPQASGAGLGVQSGKTGSDPLTIRAEKLDYSLDQHKASYQGDVVLQTQNTVLRAGRLDVYFVQSKSGSQVERAVAEEHVRVTQPGRQASGDRADYDAKLGKIVMTGGPPTLYDAARGTTTGRRLTFFTLNDSLIVDGGINSTNTSIHHVAP